MWKSLIYSTVFLQLGLLRRLNSFSLPKITTPTNPKPVVNDPLIRKLAFISQLAVFKDIIPGYRIRPLSDKEKEEKVSQMVQRQRDYEQGLVGVYQGFLQTLEQDIKSMSGAIRSIRLGPSSYTQYLRSSQNGTRSNRYPMSVYTVGGATAF